jgi:hypothetical protein
MLSDYLVADIGIAAWTDKYESDEDPNGDARDDLKDSITTGAVMGYLRPILLSRLDDAFADVGVPTCSEDDVNEADIKEYKATKQVRQRVSFPNKRYKTFSWKMEQGHWRLAAIE